MTLPSTPRAWANRLTVVLDTLMGADRFPVDVPLVARETSAQLYPGDSIVRVEGAALPGFEGALFPVAGRKGWGILFNNTITSPGRINFTLGHELGHYFVHRAMNPEGIQCSTDDLARGQVDGRDIEREADLFAADLLMPFNDFRRQIPRLAKPDLDDLSACAARYRVSLLAATLRWLSYTERRAVLVVSRDGYILWSKPSAAARKSQSIFKTWLAPIEIPSSSLAARQDMLTDNRQGILHPRGVWFREEVKEMAVFSEQYDFAISLLLMDDAPDWAASVDEGDDPVAIPVDIKFK